MQSCRWCYQHFQRTHPLSLSRVESYSYNFNKKEYAMTLLYATWHNIPEDSHLLPENGFVYSHITWWPNLEGKCGSLWTHQMTWHMGSYFLQLTRGSPTACWPGIVGTTLPVSRMCCCSSYNLCNAAWSAGVRTLFEVTDWICICTVFKRWKKLKK
jgi:hypothetical protein